MKIKIENGLIYDGSGGKPFPGDILIENDKIAAIEPREGSLQSSVSESWKPDLIIYAGHKAVTPGFLDSHRHGDLAAISDPDFGEIELAQGITTVLGGNCGLTPFPYVESTGRQMLDFIEPCLGKASEDMKFAGFSEYMAALEAAKPYINTGQMIGTGAVKIAAKGFGKEPFTKAEMDRAKGYIREALEEGAFGASIGIMYVPECYSSTAEFIELLKDVGKYNRIVTCHIRGEADGLISSVEEVLKIGREAEVPINISHFKAVGLKNWQKTIYQAIEKIDQARAAGQDVTVDFYPYTGGSTTLMTLLPPSIQEPRMQDTLNILSTRDGADLLKREIYKQHEGWDNMVLDVGWDRILISSVTKAQNKQFVGKNVQEIAEEWGYADPADFVRELLVDEEGKVGIIQMSMDPSDLDTIARLPYSMVISDALYGNTDSPHPRLYGSFPRVISDFVMKRGILKLETAIHKMTQMTAERFRIQGRGTLAVGNYADINIFNPQRLRDQATYNKPKQLSTGLDMAFINGKLVWNDNKKTGVNSAKLLRY